MEQFGMGSNLHRWSQALCAAMGQVCMLCVLGDGLTRLMCLGVT